MFVLALIFETKEIPVEQILRSSHDSTVFRSFILVDTNFHDRVSSMLKSLHEFISIIKKGGEFGEQARQGGKKDYVKS